MSGVGLKTAGAVEAGQVANLRCIGCGRFCCDPHDNQSFDMDTGGHLTEVWWGDCEHCRWVLKENP